MLLQSYNDTMSRFAETILHAKNYTHERITEDGKIRRETWEEVCERVVRSIVQPYLPYLSAKIKKAILSRKFIPGGRYLYAAGRRYQQVNNCALLDVEDSRDGLNGWPDCVSNCVNALMTGMGVGVVYSKIRREGTPVKGMGGHSSGPLSVMRMINECGREIVQGGSRRSALWAGLHWNHPDCIKFIKMKQWNSSIKECKKKDFNFPAPMDGTNISVILDDLFFESYKKPLHSLHKLAYTVYWTAVESMLRTGEPGFSVDVGNKGKSNLRNAPVTAGTHVRTNKGYVPVGNIVDIPTTLWTGKRWVDGVVFKRTMRDAPIVKVTMSNGKSIRCEPNHEFLVDDFEDYKPTSIRTKASDLVIKDILHISPPLNVVNSDEWQEVRVLSVEFDGREDVYCCDVGVEEHSFQAEGVIISNCTEVDSEDNGDICNLGSINLSRISSPEEFSETVYLGTAFLLCGTLASELPIPMMYVIREKNRRLGLGLMGVHEWLLQRGKRYGPDDELGGWLKEYKRSTDYAYELSVKLGISCPVATRSIAPTGTIGILGETTGGADTMMAVAYKRRFLKGSDWKAQYVLDPCAKRLVEAGLDPELIEDSYTLAGDIDRSMDTKVWLQEHVDQGISGTILLPAWGSKDNNENMVNDFGVKLLSRLPKVRGMTVYPDGAISGQPITRLSYNEAVKKGVGIEFNDGCDSDSTIIVSSNSGDTLVDTILPSLCKGGSCGE